ncbi:MAG TPA: hypothetical protein DCS28_00205 [Candidatus Moranbacteria bacterium]|nr:hypothetical protein [Candidatus Moranbacteria bacterium]HAT74455.1 hypothetical protein [Candidatus Moranbacteria bacterium]
MEFNQNQETENEQNANEEFNNPTMRQWFQDNLRVIVSVFIVIIIAAGIYSYSNRTQVPEEKEQNEQSDILKNLAGDEENSSEKIILEGQDSIKADKQTNQISSTTTSQETEQSFIETAGKGDSLTRLARKALADYLEKNPDSSLSPEHKIYIEDYLRKNIAYQERVFVGTTVEFSKSLIGDAIGKSKNLNENQIKNLHKYALRVPSLS